MKKPLLFVMMVLLCVTSLMAAKKVAFVYQSGYNAGRYVWTGDLASGYTPSADPIHNALAANFEVTDFVYAQTETPDLETLRTYDLVVLGEAMSGNHTLSNSLKDLVGTVPVFAMKAYNYNSGRWGWADPANPATKTTSVTINSGFENHAIFDGVEVNNGVVEIFDGTDVTTSNLIQSFTTIIDGSLIQADHIIANATGTTNSAIHEITNLDYKYMLIPISSDVVTTVSENGTKLVINACNYLMGIGDFDPDADFKIAYLYDSQYSTYKGLDADPIYNLSVIAEKNTEAIDIHSFTAAYTDTLSALENNYDLVVVTEAMSSTHAFAKQLVNLVNRVPMLNFKSFLYKSSVWGWGAGSNPTVAKTEGGVKTLTILDADHDIFAGVEGIENNQVDMFTNDTLANMLQAYTVDSTSLIYSDNVLASVNDISAIHEHGSVNKYMLIPMSFDAITVNGEPNVSEAAISIINNAVNYLLASGNILPAIAPTFSMEYGDNETYVTIESRTADAIIYYTTDGSDPTTASTRYNGSITVATDNVTLKAIATKQGNDNSDVSSIVVRVYGVSGSPVISAETFNNGKMVTITAADGAKIYYALGGVDPDSTATLYTEPFIIIRSTIVKAVAYESGKMASLITESTITPDNYITRNKTLMWANFNNQPDSLWIWANTDSTTTNSGDVIAVYSYTAQTDSTSPVLKTVTFENGFMVGSYGQRINLQLTAVAQSGDYSPATADDAGASDRAISFLKTNNAEEPASAYLITADAYRGPFDVSLWMTHAKSSSYQEKIEVSIATSKDSAAQWTVLDTLVSEGTMKLIRKFTAYYDAYDSVYVKIASVSENAKNNNVMIFDMKVMGEGEDPIIDAVESPIGSKELVSRRIYTLSGIEVKAPVNGVNIVREIYSDGTVKATKIMVRDNTIY